MSSTFPQKLILLLILLLVTPAVSFASSIGNDQGFSVGSSCGDNLDCGTGWCEANRCIYPPSGRLFGEGDGDAASCVAVCRKGVAQVACTEDKVADCSCNADLPSVHCEAAN